MATPRLLGFLLSLTLASCGLSMEEFSKQQEEARACAEGDVCVLAGGESQCTCAAPVNEARKEEIDAASRDVACGGAQVECASFENLRCEGGICRGD